MKKLLILICLSVCFYNCKSSKNTKALTNVNSRPNKTTLPEDNSVKLNTTDFPDVSNTNSNKTETVLAFNIIDYAKQFSGVRYKYGGTTKSGMDCSGLVFESFKAYDILLPRSSRDMATKGVKIKIEDVLEDYNSFIKKLRTVYPESHIVCMLGNMDITAKSSKWPHKLQQSITELNDKNVSVLIAPYKNTAGHPNEMEQERLAMQLSTHIKAVKNW